MLRLLLNKHSEIKKKRSHSVWVHAQSNTYECCHKTVWHCTDSHCKRTSSSSHVDEKRVESWNKVFWIRCVLVGFVVPVLADNPLVYSCLCPVSLQMSIWRENFWRNRFSLIATQAILSSYRRVTLVWENPKSVIGGRFCSSALYRLNYYLSRTLLWVVLPSRTVSLCIHTWTVAPESYVQSCLLVACSQHDGWMSVAGRLGNHEVTSGGGHERVNFLSLFLSVFLKTQHNHWTELMLNIWFTI